MDHEQMWARQPITIDNVAEIYDAVFAPWVKEQGLEILAVSEGSVGARLPQDPRQRFAFGAICGQAQMSAIDTTMAIAMMTSDRRVAGTTSQSTQFIRPAAGEALLIEARVLKWGRTVCFGDVHVTGENTGVLIAHATCEFSSAVD